MKKIPKVCVVIVNWNLRDYLEKCLKSLRNTNYANFEVIVVDNGSQDGSVEMIRKKFPEVHLIINEQNLGYVKGNNQGIKFALEKFNPDYIVLANSDIEFIQKKLVERPGSNSRKKS